MKKAPAGKPKKIPFVDLHSQYLQVKNKVDKAIKNIIKESAFIGGLGNKYTPSFEKNFANYIGVKYCINCANGTDALEIAMQALGIKPGDEVIVPALSWISTSESVGNCGAIPVFVDIRSDYRTIDTSKIESAITPKTKAIIPVHLYGLPAEMDEIMKIAKKHKLWVIEDCAQAHGAIYKNQKIGSIGHLATFSFFPSKNLGAYGDAGCIVTNDEKIAIKSRMIANHGMKEKHKHEFEGRNSRMDGLQAAILDIQLPLLNKWNEHRIKASTIYNKLLNGVVKTPSKPDYSKHVYHLYVIETDKRNLLKSELEKANINSVIHYPTALPFLDAYKNRKFKPSDFPIAYKMTQEILSLPMFPTIKNEQIKKVCESIKKIVS